jgi:hypothetical protein
MLLVEENMLGIRKKIILGTNSVSVGEYITFGFII